VREATDRGRGAGRRRSRSSGLSTVSPAAGTGSAEQDSGCTAHAYVPALVGVGEHDMADVHEMGRPLRVRSGMRIVGGGLYERSLPGP
jgi:hypothetical protein